MRSVQDVLRPDEDLLLKSLSPTLSAHASALLCCIDLSIEDITLSLSQTTDRHGGPVAPGVPVPSVVIERKLAASAEETRLEVLQPSLAALYAIAGPTATRHLLPSAAGRHGLAALELEISPCRIDLDLSAKLVVAALHGGEARLDFVDESAELVIGSLWAWRSLSHLSQPLRRRRQHQKLVWSIAQVSEHRTIQSFPTFLNRVSFLVGSQSNLRSDDGWKILHQLRHCLRAAEEDVEQILASPIDPPLAQELYAESKDIIGGWQSWEIDSDDLRYSDLFPFVFESKLRAVERISPTAPISLGWDVPFKLEWRAGLFEARLCDGSQVENMLAVGPLEAFVTSSGLPRGAGPIQIYARATLDRMDANVDRALLVLVRHIIKVRKTFEHKIRLFKAASAPSLSLDATPEIVSASALPNLHLDASLGVRHLSAKGRAESLEAQAALDNISLSVSARLVPLSEHYHLPSSRTRTGQAIFGIGSTRLSASEWHEEGEELILSAAIDEISLAGSLPVGESPLKLVAAARAIRGSIPEDAIRVYEFMEEWSNENLPAYDSLLAELRDGIDDAAELDMSPVDNVKGGVGFLDNAALSIELVVPLVSLEMQAMRELRAIYHARGSVGQVSRNATVQGPLNVRFAIDSQTVQFLAGSDSARAQSLPSNYSHTSFDLPTWRVKARLDSLPCRQITVLSTLDSIALSLDATMIDNIINVQDRFGKDIDDLVGAIRAKRAQVSGAPVISPASTPLIWDAKIALCGFKVGIEGPQATQWIEAELLEGVARSTTNSTLDWSTSVQNLTLSLAQRSRQVHVDSLAAFDQRDRLAFFRLDLSASNTIAAPDLVLIRTDTDTPRLNISFPRIHAVLQPSAIEALADLFDHFEREIDLRRTLRKREMEAIRERVIQTLEMGGGDKSADSSSASWFNTAIVCFEARNVGIAIPLSDEGITVTDVKPKRGKIGPTQPAFLTTLASLSLSTQKGTASQAKLERLCLQFVPDWSSDFSGAVPASHNQVVFPDMESTLSFPASGPILAQSVVSGIEIDLDTSVVAYGFALVDVYQLSHQRFAKFALQSTLDDTLPLPAPPSAPLFSAVNSTFEFKTGTIRCHSLSSGWSRTTDSSSPLVQSPASRSKTSHRKGRSVNDFGSFSNASIAKLAEAREAMQQDVFIVPGISVSAQYLANPDQLAKPPQLHVDAVMHGSSNSVFPTIVPFISSLVQQISHRSARFAVPSPRASFHSSVAPSLAQPTSLVPVKLNLSVSLKIDQSRLDISCLPASPVSARLTWASGGFLCTLSPAAGINFTASVEGVAIGLRHAYSPEDCISAEVKGMAVAVSFKPASAVKEAARLSIIVDVPELSGELNLRFLQDWLVMKAVWSGAVATSGTCSTGAPGSQVSRQIATTPTAQITTILLVRLQQVRAVFDLGQAIGKTVVVAEKVVLRLRWVPNDSRLLSLAVGSIVVTATGRTAGVATTGAILFETLLRDNDSSLIGTASELVSRACLCRRGVYFAYVSTFS